MTTTFCPQTDLDTSVLTVEQACRYVLNAIATDLQFNRAQEETLVEQARTGGKQERDKLVLYLLPYVERFAHHLCVWKIGRTEYLDLVHEGCVAILSQLDTVLSRSIQVIPYLLKTAYNAIYDEISRSRSLIVTPIDVEPLPTLSMDQPLFSDDDYTLADTLEHPSPLGVTISEDGHNHTALHDAIRALEDCERQLVVRHFGLYVNAPEPVNDILRSMGLQLKSRLMPTALTRLCLLLKDAYPQYCSPTREIRRTTVAYKPLTTLQKQRLDAARLRLQGQNQPITSKGLAREARIDWDVAQRYLKELQPHSTQEERLDAAFKEMQTRGEKIGVSALAKAAHVSNTATSLYLHMHPDYQVRNHSFSRRPAEERLQEAYAQMMAQGEKITQASLRKRAHTDAIAACTFLQRMREPQLTFTS